MKQEAPKSFNEQSIKYFIETFYLCVCVCFFFAFISLKKKKKKNACFGWPIPLTRWYLLFSRKRSQALVVKTLDSAIQWITQFGFLNSYPLERDLSGGAIQRLNNQGQFSVSMTRAALTRSIGNPNNSGARAHSGAPWVRKFGYFCIQEIVVVTKLSVCQYSPASCLQMWNVSLSNWKLSLGSWR